MIRPTVLFLGLLLAVQAIAQTSSQKAAVPLSAVVQKTPARVTLSWTTLPSTTSITIYRKLKTATSWGSALANPAASSTQYQDNSIVVGTAYEYRVTRVAAGVTGQGYICSGIEVPLSDYKGKILLLVDNTFTSSLSAELTQLQKDLRADGWAVLRSDVSRTASVSSVRNTVISQYNSDPTNVKAVFIIGHVPVPYSGNINPDGHSQHLGAWPCDGYYGEMNGTWTDNSVNNTTSQRVENRNVPGDGKFDQSTFPSNLELQVGRVDMYDMPAFSLSETELLRAYLLKAHNFKIKQWTPTARGIIFDNLQWISSPIAASGWRDITPLVGAANVTAPDVYAGNFSALINNQSYLWSYNSGGGLQAYIGSTLTFNGADLVGTAQTYASTSGGSVFNLTFGSYYGDWDNKNNFLRAPLASGSGLANCYAGIPAWYMHHMGMGDNIGYSTLLTMNNTSLYTPLTDGWQSTIGKTHLALMGDPSLRQKMLAPPTNLVISNASGTASFSWSAAPGSVDGYHLYSFNSTTGVITRLTTNPVTTTTYSNGAIPYVTGTEYMVRAVKMQVDPCGSYLNLSLGAIGAAGAAQTDCSGLTGSCSSNATNATVSASATGGLAPYTYSWNTSPAQTTSTATVTASGNYTVTITDARGCRVYCTTTVTLSTTGSCTGIRTESQTTWGATASGSNPAAYMVSNFATAFPSPNYLTIGCGTRALKLTSAAAVTAFLPCIGNIAQLPSGTLQNPGSSYSNSFAGQLTALKLSVRFDELSTAFSSSAVPLKNMLIASGTFAGWTVAQLITEADSKIGSCGSSYTRNALNDAITNVNWGYLGGTTSSGYLMCPPSGMMIETGTTETTIEPSLDPLDVSVFPNPVSGMATIMITGATYEQPTTVELYSVSGTLIGQIFNGRVPAGTEQRVQWDATNEAKGIYFYRVVSGERVAQGKIIVE
ncbi:MAG: T9SS type A sorting domain-containing protein [Flavobacteriales bacterium]